MLLRSFFARTAVVAGVTVVSLGVGGSPASAQISLATMGATYSQDFNTLATSGTSSTFPTGWALSEAGTGANATYAADNGSATSGNTYSYGTTAAADRAFGELTSGTTQATVGARFTNSTGSTIMSLVIGYTGEQWRKGGGLLVDKMSFEFSTNATSLTTGTWTPVTALDFSSPVNTATAGALDGNVGANRTVIAPVQIPSLTIANATDFWIRWTPTNITGVDQGMGVDDFTLKPSASVPVELSHITTE